MALGVGLLAAAALGTTPPGDLPVARAQSVRYVDDDAGCAGRSPCYATIQAAIAAAASGDAIDVAAGRYPESVIAVDKALWLRGPGAGAAADADDPARHALWTASGGGTGPALIVDARGTGLDNVRLEGFRIRGAGPGLVALVGRRVGDDGGLPAGLPPTTADHDIRAVRIEDCDLELAAGAPPAAFALTGRYLKDVRLKAVRIRSAAGAIALSDTADLRLDDAEVSAQAAPALRLVRPAGATDLVRLNLAAAGGTAAELVDAERFWLHRSRLTGGGPVLRLVDTGRVPDGTATDLRLGGGPAEGNVLRATGPALELVNSGPQASSSPDVDARFNDWGAPSEAQIEELVHHQPDDARLGRVDYLPALGLPERAAIQVDPVELEANGGAKADLELLLIDAAGRPAVDGGLVLWSSTGGQLERRASFVEAEDPPPALSRQDVWTTEADDRFGSFSGAGFLRSAAPGARLTWRFDAPALAIRYGQAKADVGRFRLILDGAAQPPIETRGARDAWVERVVLRDLSAGEHEVTVEVLSGSLALDVLFGGDAIRDGSAKTRLTAPVDLGDALVRAEVRGMSGMGGPPLSAQSHIYFVAGPPARIDLAADPRELASLEAAVLTADLTDDRGRPVRDGTEVRFATDHGTVDSVAATTAGRAVASFVAGTTPGMATIHAVAGAVSATARITVNTGPAYSIALTTTRQSLPANSQARAPLRAMVRDAAGQPVADGTPVRFASSLGSLYPGEDSFTQGGLALSELVAGAEAGTAFVTAAVDDLVARVNIDLVPTDLRLTKTVQPQGAVVPGEHITYSLRLVNAGPSNVYDIRLRDPMPSGLVTVNHTVLFVPRGPMFENLESDSNPRYYLGIDRLLSGQVAYLTITAKIDTSLRWGSRKTLTNCASVTSLTAAEATPADNNSCASNDVVPGAAYTVTLSTSGLAIVGGSAIDVTARVVDRDGRPAGDDTQVFFGVDDPHLGTFENLTRRTEGGKASTRFITGNKAGRGILRAVSTGDRSAQAAIRVLPGPPAQLSLASQFARLEVGSHTTLITATLTDRFGNPISDGPVRFGSDIGNLNPADARTEAGVATTTLQSGYRIGIARVRADSGSLKAGIDIPFLAGPPASLGLSIDAWQLRLGQPAILSAYLRDSFGNPVSGSRVRFSTDVGPLSPDEVNTGPEGLARSRLVAQRGGLGLVHAQAGPVRAQVKVEVQGQRIYLPRLERKR